jgi:hypothetical protein
MVVFYLGRGFDFARLERGHIWLHEESSQPVSGQVIMTGEDAIR